MIERRSFIKGAMGLSTLVVAAAFSSRASAIPGIMKRVDDHEKAIREPQPAVVTDQDLDLAKVEQVRWGRRRWGFRRFRWRRRWRPHLRRRVFWRRRRWWRPRFRRRLRYW
jgi:hypothetical protein